MGADTLTTIAANSVTFGLYSAGKSAYSFSQGDNAGGFASLSTAAAGGYGGAAMAPEADSLAANVRAKNAQDRLAGQREQQLKEQMYDKQQLDAVNAVRGRNFGEFSSFGESYGFGSGRAETGVGRGNLF